MYFGRCENLPLSLTTFTNIIHYYLKMEVYPFCPFLWLKLHMLLYWTAPKKLVCMHKQATGLDAWASRVKCPIYMRYVYIYMSYFCCLFIIATWWYVWCIVWASGRVGVNSILELELQLNSNSNSGIGIGIEIGGIENGIGIENSWIGIEKLE